MKSGLWLAVRFVSYETCLQAPGVYELQSNANWVTVVLTVHRYRLWPVHLSITCEHSDSWFPSCFLILMYLATVCLRLLSLWLVFGATQGKWIQWIERLCRVTSAMAVTGWSGYLNLAALLGLRHASCLDATVSWCLESSAEWTKMTVTKVMSKWLRHFAHIQFFWILWFVPGNSEWFGTAGKPGRPRPLRLGSGHASSLAKIHTSGSEAEHVETEKTTYRQILCDATFSWHLLQTASNPSSENVQEELAVCIHEDWKCSKSLKVAVVLGFTVSLWSLAGWNSSLRARQGGTKMP